MIITLKLTHSTTSDPKKLSEKFRQSDQRTQSTQGALDPVQSALDPVQSALDPIQSALDPIQSALDPIQSALDPVQSSPSALAFTSTAQLMSQTDLREVLRSLWNLFSFQGTLSKCL
ncbi:hypothetical protein DFH28DRAFT_906562 [Melampsora americana]|nr:hypothetical protein DFH28DRAFT_906562 [Melampsora americana]